MAQLTIQQTFDLAMEHHHAGRLKEAEQIYKEILAQEPGHVETLHYLGVVCAQLGRRDDAVRLMRQAVERRPNYPEAMSNLGFALKQIGRVDEAIAAYRRAIDLKPDYAAAVYNLGAALHSKGQLQEAVAAYRRAIALQPSYVEAHANLGNALRSMGQLDEAMAASRQALAINPNLPEAHNNLGNSLQSKGRTDEAIAAYREAIALRPDLPEVHNNLGVALKDKGQLDEAIAAFGKAISCRPDYADAHNNLGNVLKEKGQLDLAMAAYRQAMTLNPKAPEHHSNLVLLLHYHPDCDARAIADEHRQWNVQHAQPLGQFICPYSNDRSPDRRLRIGYLSPDFREHVVGQNLLPLFGQHDRKQFEITCYAQVFRPDAMTRRLEQHADRWLSIVGLPDENVVKQIREDEIDILVDLALHSANNRLPIFARKPAPVQVSYLGYCGSSGIDAMDYRFSDPYLDPADADLSYYTEKTIRLRSYWCYQPWRTAPETSQSPAMKNGSVTFGCLNNFAKVSSAALDLWGRILAAVPKSRIIIHAPPGGHRADVAERMRLAGVDGDRLQFVAQQPWMEYIKSYCEIDISLDPFPFGGGITTCDALWMGVPVVTLSGDTAVGRGGRSILSNLGLTELVAFTPDEYAQIAIDLARDLDRMTSLRRGTRARMLASPLMDAEKFARDVEAAYRRMWHVWCETHGRDYRS